MLSNELQRLRFVPWAVTRDIERYARPVMLAAPCLIWATSFMKSRERLIAPSRIERICGDVMRHALIVGVSLLLVCGCASTSDHTPLKSGDCVVITYVGSYVPDFRAVIDSSGAVTPPLLGNVAIASLTLEEAAVAIDRAYQTQAPSFRVHIAVSRCR